MTGEPFILSEATWKSVRETGYQVAVLPWGATEAHNYHLPYGTDNYETERVAVESARRAWAAGAKVIVLPCVPFGVNTGQLDIPFCLNMNPGTQAMLLGDLVEAMEGQGIRKLVIVNGHGGNDFRQMIREITPRTSMFICAINWYSCLDPRPFFDEPGDHAGELETSLMMQVRPDLVGPLSEAGPGRARKFRIGGLRDGWAWAPRAWTKVTDDTGTGNPAAATPEKGKAYLDAVSERIGGFFVELAHANRADMYE